jgi:hypothetical protein
MVDPTEWRVAECEGPPGWQEWLREDCGDRLCSFQLREADLATGAPDKVNDYKQLQVTSLTTNQGVGSSNLSGRANFQ